jgi:hypothetical protein
MKNIEFCLSTFTLCSFAPLCLSGKKYGLKKQSQFSWGKMTLNQYRQWLMEILMVGGGEKTKPNKANFKGANDVFVIPVKTGIQTFLIILDSASSAE